MSETAGDAAQRLLLFDSGIGGLSVLHEIRRVLPSASIAYVADDAGFPYGDWEEGALTDRVVALMEALIPQHRPDLVVIPCNTASTLVLPALRARFGVPFVGTVPAIKPAAERTVSGVVSVLATPGTMKREYTRDLIARFASTCHVRLVGSSELARYAEQAMRGDDVPDDAIAAEIAPAFLDLDGRRTDTIVLACTHYPFLIDRFRRLSPWPVTFIDPAEAIARRVLSVLEAEAEPEDRPMRPGLAFLTSGNPWPEGLILLLSAFALEPGTVSRDPVPFTEEGR